MEARTDGRKDHRRLGGARRVIPGELRPGPGLQPPQDPLAKIHISNHQGLQPKFRITRGPTHQGSHHRGRGGEGAPVAPAPSLGAKLQLRAPLL